MLDCGPTLLINACKWAGKTASYVNHFDYFAELLDYNEVLGTYIPRLGFILCKFKKPFKVVNFFKKPKITDLLNNLSDNKCIVFLNETNGRSHVGLIISKTDKYVTLVNWDKKKTVKRFKISTIKEWLKNPSTAYVIQKT